jgi:hypothetical protein
MKQQLLNLISQPTSQFTDIIAWIDDRYSFTPTRFHNGEQLNEANQNNGSCKVFALALLFELTQQETLGLFCEHYAAVLNRPEASEHQNIRQFISHSFAGLKFDGTALVARI